MSTHTWKLKDKDSCEGCPFLELRLENYETDKDKIHRGKHWCLLHGGYIKDYKRDEYCKQELGE